MKAFGWNLLLALAWCAVSGSLSSANILLGFLVGYGILAWLSPSEGARRYVRRTPLAAAFIGFYLYDVVVSTLRVAWDVVTPSARRRPGILALPLDVDSDLEITMLANLITFTPGTLALDVTADRRFLILHEMFVKDPEETKARLKARLERWILRLLR